MTLRLCTRLCLVLTGILTRHHWRRHSRVGGRGSLTDAIMNGLRQLREDEMMWLTQLVSLAFKSQETRKVQ